MQIPRPDFDVSVVEPAQLDGEVGRLAPALVVCSQLTPAVQAQPLTWIVLYPDYERRTEVSVAGQRSTTDDFDLKALLSLIDRVRRLTDV